MHRVSIFCIDYLNVRFELTLGNQSSDTYRRQREMDNEIRVAWSCDAVHDVPPSMLQALTSSICGLPIPHFILVIWVLPHFAPAWHDIDHHRLRTLDFRPQKTTLFAVADSSPLLSSTNSKMYMYLNNRDIQFSFAYVQRCYTISYCWDHRTKNSEWARLPDQVEMVWYEYTSCKGDSFLAKGGTHGSIDFTGTRLYEKISSFMVRQSGLYPTNGIVDYCHENTMLASTNSSEILYVDSDEANVGVSPNSSDIVYFDMTDENVEISPH